MARATYPSAMVKELAGLLAVPLAALVVFSSCWVIGVPALTATGTVWPTSLAGAVK